ncbi:glycerol kinase GlpK [Propylenella binzhouense]|uniref:Glycerol kinase n=1 Tax=Propylenella binzhouense TaxID=2555902 RepID=A0A964T7E8_9HYPH|nr:glycerol kinase GlpK [Propylenella binzhouense]MYZ49277.1 glycerol kinase GlpK [Propylenella binzhouense]
MTGYVLALDQGTTSSRAILFDPAGRIVAADQQEFRQHFPAPGQVEHDPEDLWTSTVATGRNALAKAGIRPAEVAAIGIANQRETTLVWDRATGRPVHPAIVWQDRRTASLCAALRAEGAEPIVAEKTGLILDPYFSASKIAWMLDAVPGARAEANAGRLAFGTVDAWLLWRLTSGSVHATDVTNASRTLLFDIRSQDWDDGLLALFGIPRRMLPEVLDCAAAFGTTDPDVFGAAIPILGVAGDQQAATLGQACFRPGMLKSTYGTGCFAVLNTGATPVVSKNKLLTTIACRLGGRTTYALEGSIFIAGAAVQWLRDGLGLIAQAEDSGRLAAAADPEQDVVLVPAFTGLGAPHWDADARGALFGLTRATGPAEIARAALEAVCFQTRDLLEAMHRDWGAGGAETVLRVDGGMVASDWMMQRLADLLDAPVDRPNILETTALGAAWLAGSAAGLWPDADGFAATWQCERRFQPAMGEEERRRRTASWREAVRRTLSGAAPR